MGQTLLELRLLVHPMAAMVIIPGKESSPCSMVPTDNHLDLLDLTANRTTATHHQPLMDIPLRRTLLTRLQIWALILRPDHRMTFRGRLNPPSMMIVSVLSVPLLMMTPITRTLMLLSLLIRMRALDIALMTRAPTAAAVMSMLLRTVVLRLLLLLPT
jgi:hypothetical protein